MSKTFNLNEEQRCGHTISADMKRVWQVELDLLEKLINVCNEHGIRMWADGGTMLGAIRHHGYIPWDDDIDISIPRPDYDRLKEIAPKVFKEPYLFQTTETDEHYFRGHAQLRRTDTAAIRPSDSYRPFCQGIFIDIFIIEGVPDDNKEIEPIVKFVSHRIKCLKSIDYPILISGRIGLLLRKYIWKWKVRRYGFYNLYKPIEEALRKHSWDNCNRVAKIGNDGLKLVYPKHIFDETIVVDFEYLKLPVPAGYDEFLRIQYGDNYMTPVMTPTTHGELLLDAEHSYKQLLPLARKLYKQKQLSKLAFWK